MPSPFSERELINRGAACEVKILEGVCGTGLITSCDEWVDDPSSVVVDDACSAAFAFSEDPVDRISGGGTGFRARKLLLSDSRSGVVATGVVSASSVLGFVNVLVSDSAARSRLPGGL